MAQRFEYLIRLDKLSEPSINKDSSTCRLVDDTEDELLPQGYVRVQVQNDNEALSFSEFVTVNGFLRRLVF